MCIAIGCLIVLVGTAVHRVEERIVRDKSLEDVTAVLGVRSPNGRGGNVTRSRVARMLGPALERCRPPACAGPRCALSVAVADPDGSVEVRVWGEKGGVEWEPVARLGPSPSVPVSNGHWLPWK